MKDNEKNRARELRLCGKSLSEISSILNVSKSSVSGWVKDLPQPEHFTKEYRYNLSILKQEKKLKNKKSVKDYIFFGDGRKLIRTPKGYLGNTYMKGRYIYEHRYVMEKKLGRLLESNEIVHHIDEDMLNNVPDNLIITTASNHARHHMKKDVSELFISLVCAECGNSFSKQISQWRRKVKLGQTYFYCNRKCQHKSLINK